MPESDDTRWGSPSFSPQAWLNASLREASSRPPDAGPAEPLGVRLSVLLTKLQLQAADVDTAMQEASLTLAHMAPSVAADVGAAQEQARSTRGELAALLEQAAAIEASSAAAVREIRQVLSFQQAVAAAGSTLAHADQTLRALDAAERSFSRGDSAAAAASLSTARARLSALGGQASRLLPTAAGRTDALVAKLEDGLRPALLEAISGRQPAEVARHAATLRALGAASAVADAYVQCAQGPLFERWNVARRGFDGAASGAADVAAALAAFFGAVGETAGSEFGWLSKAMAAGEAAPLVVQALTGALETLRPPLEAALSSCLPPPGGPPGAASAEAASGEAALAALERAWAAAAAAAESVRATLAPHGEGEGGAGGVGEGGAGGVGGGAGAACEWSARLSRTSSAGGGEGGGGEGGGGEGGASCVVEGLLAPFEGAQQAAASLCPLLVAAEDAAARVAAGSISTHRAALDVLRAVGTAAETTAPPLLEALQAAAARLLPFCGSLGADALRESQAALVRRLVDDLRAHLRAVAAFDGGAAAGSGAAGGTAAVAVLEHDDSDEEEGAVEVTDVGKALARQALGTLRTLHGLRRKLVDFERAAAAARARHAAAQLRQQTGSSGQREAARRLAAPAADSSRGSLGEGGGQAAELVLEGQKAALALLVAPIREALRAISAPEAHGEWGAAAGGGGEGEGEEDEEAATALLAFSATPKAYITRVGEHLLGMFLLLEPYAAGAALCELHADLRAPADEEEDADLEPERANVVAWMGAVATRTKSLLLAAVEALPALSAAGAKQLAADVGYLSNIFAAGLSLPHAELTELEGLLTCDLAGLPAIAESAVALRPAFAAAVVTKRQS